MSGVFRAVGQVAGIVASVAMFIPGGQPIAAIASAVAAVASVGAALTYKKPPQQGSATDITIGPNLLSPYLMGEAYYGGARVTQVGYGVEDGIDNAHAWIVDVVSVGGPLHAHVADYTDFNTVTFTSSPDNNADGYFYNNLHRHYQLGATPESAALTPHWSGAPDWGSSYKLSGKAAIGWSARWPKKDNVFSSGFPQTGSVWQGVLAYDPRLDSTYTGGSGSHRWADPVTDKASFSTAKATWEYTANPGLHALRYCLGIWERDESTTNDYVKVFGIGGKWDQLVVEDFVTLANLCDANSWTVNGLIYEPGDKWQNLKRILAAGGAEPVFKGGRLGIKINAAKIALDTIQLADIGEGEIAIPGTQSYKDRKNTIRPKFVDPNSRWQPVPTTTPVQVTSYVTEDGGEEKAEEILFELVTNADQAAQLAGVELVNRREQRGISLPVTPRLRGYRCDQALEVSAAVKSTYGISTDMLVIESASRDLQSMSWAYGFRSETEDKYAWAYALTGTSPPSPTIAAPEDWDAAAAGLLVDSQVEFKRVTSHTVPTTIIHATDTGTTSDIVIDNHTRVYGDGSTLSITGATITGVPADTIVALYYDDDTLADTTPSFQYTTTYADAQAAAASGRHFLGFITTPAAGSSATRDGGGVYPLGSNVGGELD